MAERQPVGDAIDFPSVIHTECGDLVAQLAEALEPVVTAALTAPRPPLLKPEAAAVLLGVPKSWVMAEARADRIPHRRLGKYVRFDADELVAWADERRCGAGSGPVPQGRARLAVAGDSAPSVERGTARGTRRVA